MSADAASDEISVTPPTSRIESGQVENSRHPELRDVSQPSTGSIIPESPDLAPEVNSSNENLEADELNETRPESQFREAEGEIEDKRVLNSPRERFEQDVRQIEQPQGELVLQEAGEESNVTVVSPPGHNDTESRESAQSVPTIQSRREETSSSQHEANTQVSESQEQRFESGVSETPRQEPAVDARNRTFLPSRRAVRIRPVPTRVERLAEGGPVQEGIPAIGEDRTIRQSVVVTDSPSVPTSFTMPSIQSKVDETLASSPAPQPTTGTVNARSHEDRSSGQDTPQYPAMKGVESAQGAIQSSVFVRQSRSLGSNALTESVDVNVIEASVDSWPELPHVPHSQVVVERTSEESSYDFRPYYSLPLQNVDDSLDDSPNHWPRLPDSRFMSPAGDDWQAESRARKRIKRLEEEQRGVLWNESPF
jgi:hypothetical protein